MLVILPLRIEKVEFPADGFHTGSAGPGFIAVYCIAATERPPWFQWKPKPNLALGFVLDELLFKDILYSGEDISDHCSSAR